MDDLSVVEPTDDEIIRRHDFEKHKQQIGEFSKNAPRPPKIQKFKEFVGPLGLFEHKITGSEANKNFKAFQIYAVDNNKRYKEVIKEFDVVYHALDALDRDYIQFILNSLRVAEKAREEAKTAQMDIDETIERLKQTVEILKAFKEKVELSGDGRFVTEEIDAVKAENSRLKRIMNVVIIFSVLSIVLSMASLLLLIVGGA